MIAKNARRYLIAAAGGSLVLALGATSVFAGNVTETRPDCVEASAVLDGDSGAPDRIHQFINDRKGLPEVQVVSWNVAYPVNGMTTAYGVKCKSGLACNNFSHDYAAAFPESSPQAFCGPSVMFTGETPR